jgi:exosortase/archaeosortase family protein
MGRRPISLRGPGVVGEGSYQWRTLPWRRIAIGLGILFLSLQVYPLFIHSVVGEIASSWNAALLWLILHGLGQHPTLEGSTIIGELTRFVVIPECTIFAPLSLYTAGLVIFPATIGEKIRAFLLGFLVLSLVNLVRLLTLYFLLGASSQLFEAAHLFVWQPIMALTALVLWGVWAERRTRGV